MLFYKIRRRVTADLIKLMTLRGWIILDYLMGTEPNYRYHCKRGERQKALEERRECGHTSRGWNDGTTSQEHLQPHKVQRVMDGFSYGAFRESMALLTPHNVWPGNLILDFWFPEFGENTLLLFEATKQSSETQNRVLPCALE